jgi:circadian clock protein KaiB
MKTPASTEERNGGAAPDHPKYRLRLYIAGATPRSTEAVSNITAVCERHLSGRFDLEVADVYQQPEMLHQDDIVALPTLVRLLPLPLRRMVGNLADEERVVVGLGLVPDEEKGPEPSLEGSDGAPR